MIGDTLRVMHSSTRVLPIAAFGIVCVWFSGHADGHSASVD